jgi:hypothetical protein
LPAEPAATDAAHRLKHTRLARDFFFKSRPRGGDGPLERLGPARQPTRLLFVRVLVSVGASVCAGF